MKASAANLDRAHPGVCGQHTRRDGNALDCGRRASRRCSQPTKEHEMFKFDVGMWDATMKIWPAPDAEPMESKGTEKNELLAAVCGCSSRFEGKIGEMKFSGAGTFGYDPTEKKFVGTWVDSMNPYMLTMKGDYDEATKTMTMMGENREPDGKMHKSKEISRRLDDNTRLFELHMQGDDGKYFKMIEIKYKRRSKEKSE